MEFVGYELEKPKYDVEECQQRDMTYSAPLKVTLRLIVFDIDEETGAKSVKDIKEQDVFMGDMPLMTPNGTFVVLETSNPTKFPFKQGYKFYTTFILPIIGKIFSRDKNETI